MKRIFTKIFNYALEIAARPRAIYFLFLHSFFESWFFIPIPPDVVLVPMTLSKPKKAWFYAGMTLLGSVLGSCIGFAIGFFALDYALELFTTLGLQSTYVEAMEWFAIWGVGVVFVAGISIVPYWLFTITAGAMDLNFVFFVMAALASRGIRFYLVAWAAYYGGEKGMPTIRRYIDRLGWAVLIVFVLFVVFKSI